MTNKLNVIIDTNVFISAFITSDMSSPTIKILDLFYDDKISLYYSDDIISEYKDVLNRNERVSHHLVVTFYFFNYKFYGTIAERRKIMSSLIIRNALTRKRGSDLVDIKIMDGKINEISTKVSDKDIELLYDMITNMAAKVLNMKGHEMSVDGNADLVVLNCKDVKHAIWYHEEPVHVIKNGVIIK